jgi:hypothetical protein
VEDLVQWLGAQLDEDERIARAATLGPWVQSGIGDYGWTVDFGRPGAGVETANTEQGLADADFIAAHNPARVLREIDAKRRMLDRFTQADAERTYIRERYRAAVLEGDDDRARSHQRELHEATLRLQIHRAVAGDLASAYAGRPGYREEWRQ